MFKFKAFVKGVVCPFLLVVSFSTLADEWFDTSDYIDLSKSNLMVDRVNRVYYANITAVKNSDVDYQAASRLIITNSTWEVTGSNVQKLNATDYIVDLGGQDWRGDTDKKYQIFFKPKRARFSFNVKYEHLEPTYETPIDKTEFIGTYGNFDLYELMEGLPEGGEFLVTGTDVATNIIAGLIKDSWQKVIPLAARKLIPSDYSGLALDLLQAFGVFPSASLLVVSQDGKIVEDYDFLKSKEGIENVRIFILIQTPKLRWGGFTNIGSLELQLNSATTDVWERPLEFLETPIVANGDITFTTGVLPLQPNRLYAVELRAGYIEGLYPSNVINPSPTTKGNGVDYFMTSDYMDDIGLRLEEGSFRLMLKRDVVLFPNALIDDGMFKFNFDHVFTPVEETLSSYSKFSANDGRTMEVTGSTSKSNLANYSVTKTVNLDSSDLNPNMLIGDVTGDDNYEIVIAKANKVYIYDSELSLLSKTTVASNNYKFILDDVEGDSKKEIILGSYKTNQNRLTIVDGNGNVNNSFSPRTGTTYQASGQSINPEYYLGNGKLLARYNAGYSRDYRGFGVIDLNSNTEDWYYDIGPIPTYFVKGQFDNDAEEEFITSVFTPHNGASGTGKNGVGTRTYDGDLYLISVDENGNEEFTTKFGHDTSGGANGSTKIVYTPLSEGGEPSMVGFVGHYSSYPGQSQFRIVNPTTGQTTNSANYYYSEQASIAIADIDNDGDKEILAPSLHSEKGYVYDNNLNIIDNIPFGGTIFGIADLDGDNQKEYVLRGQSNRKLLKLVDAKTHNVELSLNISTPDLIYHALPTDANRDGISEIYVVDKNRVMKITE